MGAAWYGKQGLPIVHDDFSCVAPVSAHEVAQAGCDVGHIAVRGHSQGDARHAEHLTDEYRYDVAHGLANLAVRATKVSPGDCAFCSTPGIPTLFAGAASGSVCRAMRANHSLQITATQHQHTVRAEGLQRTAIGKGLP